MSPVLHKKLIMTGYKGLYSYCMGTPCNWKRFLDCVHTIEKTFCDGYKTHTKLYPANMHPNACVGHDIEVVLISKLLTQTSNNHACVIAVYFTDVKLIQQQ